MQVDIRLRKDADLLLNKALPSSDNCVYMCIGTQSVLSDSLGPLVGTILQQQMKKPIFVYGFAENNITALNIVSSYALIRLLHPDKKIVVIDAAVGDVNEVGTVQIAEGGLIPGAATNKNLPRIGDIGIAGIVSKRGLQDFYQTSYDRKLLVEQMAGTIAAAITGM